VFAEVAEPRGLLHLPDLDPPRVAVCSSGDGEVKFIAMDGASLGTTSRGQLFTPHDVQANHEDPNAILVA
jgi:hypothetical protein